MIQLENERNAKVTGSSSQGRIYEPAIGTDEELGWRISTITSDHCSASVSTHGWRRTTAFLLKGLPQFREMTWKRVTIRELTVRPGDSRGKYFLIDGQATYSYPEDLFAFLIFVTG